MTRPTTYAVQDGCHNCRHVWVPRGYDDGWRNICLYGAQPAPGEAHDDMALRIEKNTSIRDVDPAGKCDQWELDDEQEATE